MFYIIIQLDLKMCGWSVNIGRAGGEARSLGPYTPFILLFPKKIPRVLSKCPQPAGSWLLGGLSLFTFWGKYMVKWLREWKPEIAYSSRLPSRLLLYPAFYFKSKWEPWIPLPQNQNINTRSLYPLLRGKLLSLRQPLLKTVPLAISG